MGHSLYLIVLGEEASSSTIKSNSFLLLHANAERTGTGAAGGGKTAEVTGAAEGDLGVLQLNVASGRRGWQQEGERAARRAQQQQQHQSSSRSCQKTSCWRSLWGLGTSPLRKGKNTSTRMSQDCRMQPQQQQQRLLQQQQQQLQQQQQWLQQWLQKHQQQK
ncbi:hypothetical protein Efla_004027 [Eimeria flavescens]